MFVFAQTVHGILDKFTETGKDVITLLQIVAVVVFLWGVVKFISAGGNQEKIKTAKGFIIWGLVGIFVLVSLQGLIYLLQQMFFDGVPPTTYTPPSQPSL